MITAPSLRSSKGIAWRSKSLMMLEESSAVRSVKRVVICGVVTRMMTNAKKAISAVVTAIIAISRDAPRLLRKATRLCTNCPQGFGPRDRLGNYCLGDGFHMVTDR